MPIHRVFPAAAFLSLVSIAAAQPGGGGDRPRLAQPPDPEAFAARMLERDANGDGKLSRDELTGPFAQRLFESNDANADGFLERGELIEAGKSLGQGGGFGRRPEGERPGVAPGVLPGDRPGFAPGVALDFEGAMSQAGRALRRLRRSPFDDTSREEDLRAIQSLQANLIAAKGGVDDFAMAPQAKERYGEDVATYRADFRLQLIQTVMESLALEAAVIEGDTVAAKESLEHLLEAQKAGHEAFQPEEDEEHEEPETGGDAEDDLPTTAPVSPGDTTRAPGGAGQGGRGG
ncbi:MAG TPA: hypothetical protein VFF69_10450 [Phycisphaerales bacterium]|nr:hypothetical protein [Phycisphaerales bacterium]